MWVVSPPNGPNHGDSVCLYLRSFRKHLISCLSKSLMCTLIHSFLSKGISMQLRHKRSDLLMSFVRFVWLVRQEIALDSCLWHAYQYSTIYSYFWPSPCQRKNCRYLYHCIALFLHRRCLNCLIIICISYALHLSSLFPFCPLFLLSLHLSRISIYLALHQSNPFPLLSLLSPSTCQSGIQHVCAVIHGRALKQPCTRIIAQRSMSDWLPTHNYSQFSFKRKLAARTSLSPTSSICYMI